MTAPSSKHRLLLVSNRLPIAMQRDEEGRLNLKPGSGGLVTALAPLLRDRGGVWIGWPGLADLEKIETAPLLDQASKASGFNLTPVYLSKDDAQGFYDGFSNEIIWPLFHDLQLLCNFNPDYWTYYQQVNEKFAETILQNSNHNDYVWVHDYHLMLLGQKLRQKGFTSALGFFLHIPFPPMDIFIKLPWRFELIRALLEFDLIGFQTMRDRRNFIHCVRMLLKDVRIETKSGMHVCHLQDREVRVGSFPISIDYKNWAALASSKEVEQGAWRVHESYPEQKMVFSVDRLDHTKGIPFRLEAIRYFLKRHPELHQKATFIQVVVPSRVEIPKYHQLKIEIDRLVGEINSEFSKESWVPIHHHFRSLTPQDLVSYYRTSEVGFVSPIQDGMNLVAKEYVACNIDESGVLILSEFAGAASQLHEGALLVNPYDIAGVSEAIYKALTMPDAEKKKRMRKMRRNIKRYDIFWWVEAFLSTAFHKELVDFPLVTEFIPKEAVKIDELISR